MIKKIKILLFLFVTCSANVFAQNFHNRIVFKGGFEPTDTVYVFTKKEHLHYTITFDSTKILLQGILGMMVSERIPDVRKIIIIYNGKIYIRRNNSPLRQITIYKNKKNRLIIKKQKRQLYL
jgi:hypothetical protein